MRSTIKTTATCLFLSLSFASLCGCSTIRSLVDAEPEGYTPVNTASKERRVRLNDDFNARYAAEVEIDRQRLPVNAYPVSSPERAKPMLVSDPRPMQKSGGEYDTSQPRIEFNRPAPSKTAASGRTAPRTRSVDNGPPATIPVRATVAREQDRNAALIGLYGELVSNSPSAGLPYDGTGNLAQVTFATDGACFDPAIDASGRMLAFASTMHRRTSDIYVKSTRGSTITQLTTDPADDVMPEFSPNGQRVAFASNRAGNWNIYITSIDGGRPMQLSNDPEAELHPTWSPDGAHIAYCKFGARSGRWEIWMTNVENPSVRRFLEYGMFPQWNPDIGRNQILFQRARQRGSRLHSIWTIDLVEFEAVHPTEVVAAGNAAVINPAWSPDGRHITFVTVTDPELEPGARPTESDVWIVDANGMNRTSLTSGIHANYQPVWAKDGHVYFVSNRSDTDNIWAVSTGRAVQLIKPMDPTYATVPDHLSPPGE